MNNVMGQKKPGIPRYVAAAVQRWCPPSAAADPSSRTGSRSPRAHPPSKTRLLPPAVAPYARRSVPGIAYEA
eukprot:1925927-Rhodomonas_salina.3